MRKKYRVKPGKTLRSMVAVSSTNVNLLYNMDTLIKRHAGFNPATFSANTRMKKRYRVEPGKTLRSMVAVSSTNANLLYNMDTLIKRHAGLACPGH
jgi:anaerobic ribonucleoside-triphosphate reductase